MEQEVNMSDLLAEHNVLASQLGRPQSSSFKSIEAAQAAILKLKTIQGSNMPDQPPTDQENPTAQEVLGEGATPVGATDAQLQAAMAAAAAAAGSSPMNSVNRRGPTQGVGAYCKELILQGKSNAEILAAVAVKFHGTAKTSASCVAFYRNALKGGAASRPRTGKVDISAMETRVAELTKRVEEAKAAQAAKELAAKQQAELWAKMQAEQAAIAANGGTPPTPQPQPDVPPADVPPADPNQPQQPSA
jgi:hypothetical protein